MKSVKVGVAGDQEVNQPLSFVGLMRSSPLVGEELMLDRSDSMTRDEVDFMSANSGDTNT